MKGAKVKSFMTLAGQAISENLESKDEETRRLGAQLLLSEVLEYVIHGLGVTPEWNGVRLESPDGLSYVCTEDPDPLEMIDGLADVAYTMYWNALAFGIPLEQAFEEVCDNNLEKFVVLDSEHQEGELAPEHWNCGKDISWPQEVCNVEIVKIDGTLYAVGKDGNGKVRKPSSYQAVNLRHFLE